jgi:sec-independent protein translocase protein TatA
MPIVGHSWVLLLLLLIVVLIIWGPGKLSQLGGALGKSVRDFRKSSSGAPGEPDPGTKDNPTMLDR